MAKGKPDYAQDDAFGATYEALDPDFVAWMTAHEESVRQAWVYDEIWCKEFTPLVIDAVVVKHGVIEEHWGLFGFGSKWTKRKAQTESTFEGLPLASFKESYDDVRFVCRRARNTMTGETLYYVK